MKYSKKRHWFPSYKKGMSACGFVDIRAKNAKQISNVYELELKNGCKSCCRIARWKGHIKPKEVILPRTNMQIKALKKKVEETRSFQESIDEKLHSIYKKVLYMEERQAKYYELVGKALESLDGKTKRVGLYNEKRLIEMSKELADFKREVQIKVKKMQRNQEEK